MELEINRPMKRNKKPAPRPLTPNQKYSMYEAAVQDAQQHVDFFQKAGRELLGREPRILREDFCGTSLICAEWVKRDPQNTAFGLDLDPEPLAHGKKVHHSKLTKDQQNRIELFEQNVISKTKKADITVGCNFSFNIFEERATLVNYFKKVRESLVDGGLHILEAAGGPGMIEEMKEQKTLKKANGEKWFTYIWNQKSFDPITRHGSYSINFKMPDGRMYKDAFVYEWRMWTIPELKDCFMDAGYSDVHVFWELEEDSNDYVRTDKANNDHAWIAYVCGQK